MLQRLLALLAEGKPHTTNTLAAALGVPAGMVSVMAGQLARQGYLEELAVDGCGTETCGGCSSSSACQLIGPSSRAWALTPKGRRAAQK